MQHFTHDGYDFAFIDEGEGDPVLLIHGFGSSHSVNWVTPGWVQALNQAGYRAIALDNRGHGQSEKIYDAAAYTPEAMAGAITALFDRDLSVLGACARARAVERYRWDTTF